MGCENDGDSQKSSMAVPVEVLGCQVLREKSDLQGTENLLVSVAVYVWDCKQTYELSDKKLGDSMCSPNFKDS